MNKQGFTLVEMLIVIVILVTLGLIVTFSITGIVRNSSDKLYQVQVDSIIDATRYPSKYIDKKLADLVIMGASPRGSIAFMEASKAMAILNGRAYVTPDDVKAVAFKVLRHRIALSFQALASNIESEVIIDAIMKVIPTP